MAEIGSIDRCLWNCCCYGKIGHVYWLAFPGIATESLKDIFANDVNAVNISFSIALERWKIKIFYFFDIESEPLVSSIYFITIMLINTSLF